MSERMHDHRASILERLRHTAVALAADLDELLADPVVEPALPFRLALAHALALSDQLAELRTTSVIAAQPLR
jgi:hypothetical protein